MRTARTHYRLYTDSTTHVMFKDYDSYIAYYNKNMRPNGLVSGYLYSERDKETGDTIFTMEIRGKRRVNK